MDHSQPSTSQRSASEYSILVFDSGVGGLSIVKHIRHILPDVAINYLADNALFPYGLLSNDELVDRTSSLISAADKQLKPDVIVIGCNSASTLALPRLRQNLSTPIVGVVPAIKPAAQLSQTKVIGLLATPGTIQRDYTDDLIKEFASDCTVVKIGSSELVLQAEKKLAEFLLSHTNLNHSLAPFIEHPLSDQIDTVVLACTHFPLLKDELARQLPHVIHWVDSGEAIARRVQHVLSELSNVPISLPSENAFFTDLDKVSTRLTTNLRGYGFKSSKKWPITTK